MQQRPDRLIVQLPNRIILVAQELHTAPVVSAQVWIKTGSIYEQEHVGAGLSHFLEHLLSGGSTSHRTEEQTRRILGQIGAQTNAATSLDNVHYYITTTREHAGVAIDLLCDWMQNSLISLAEYDRERQVIQREFEHGMGSPQRIFWKLTQQARYENHPARFPTIGYLDEFLSITRDEINDFYHRMYVPNNMVFVVVGDIDKHKIIAELTAKWKDAPAKPLPTLSFPVEKPIDQPREAGGLATVANPKLRLAWPGTRMGGEGDYALDLLSAILGEGESSRLARTVRDQQGLATSIDAYNLSFPWGEGYFGVDAEVAPPEHGATTSPQQRVEKVKQAILEQVQAIVKDGVRDEELARAKRQTLAAVLYAGQSAQALASRLAQDIIGTGDPDYLYHYGQAVQQVTAQQILDVAKKFLEPDRLITIKLMPDTTGQAPPELRRPPQSPATGLPREPVNLDNASLSKQMEKEIIAHSQAAPTIEISPIQRTVLDNGLRVLIQRSTLVPAAAIQMYRLGGLLSDATGQEGLANAAAAMTTKGTATRSAADIDRVIEDLGANLASRCGNNTVYTTAMCLRDDLPTVLDLFADVTLHPHFPDEEWHKLQPRLLAGISREMDNWNGELNADFRKTYFGENHPWSRTPLGRADVVRNAKVSDLASFYHSRLAAGEAVLAIFGDVDPTKTLDMVRKLFADMPAKAQQPFAWRQPHPAQTGEHRFVTDKPLAAVQIGLGPGVARNSPDYPTLAVLSSVLSDFPSGWLEDQLRGDGPGLAYAVWTYQITGLAPGYLAVGFNTQPSTVDEAMKRAMSVIDRAKAQPVDKDDLQRAKASVLASEFLSRQTNDQRASDAALNELYGVGLEDSERFLAAVGKLTADDLLAAARKYLVNPVTVIIQPQPATTQP
ncbi:MAG: insulinase family protein [Phycisphaeraceae bacterium]|nr:insulinase family protein [Phycisphaeraceae bacterium]